MGKKNSNKERILEKIKKANSEKYKTTWDKKGVPHSKKKSNIKRGKKSRAAGRRFELKVRKDLEKKGWLIDKWSNNVEFSENDDGEEEGKIIPAKRKYNPFRRALVIGTGFPDFIAIKKISKGCYDVQGIEVKMKGYLSKEEKKKCRLYLSKNIFSKIWIAKSVRNGRYINIEYIDFKDKYEK